MEVSTLALELEGMQPPINRNFIQQLVPSLLPLLLSLIFFLLFFFELPSWEPSHEASCTTWGRNPMSKKARSSEDHEATPKIQVSEIKCFAFPPAKNHQSGTRTREQEGEGEKIKLENDWQRSGGRTQDKEESGVVE